MIVIDNVKFRYPYDQFDLLKGVSFTLYDGVNTVLADAQSGKSSICKLLLKDISPTSGQIFVNGREISGITNSNLDILYLPRNPIFFEGRSVQYNMEYPLKIRKVDVKQRQERVRELAQQFNLPLKLKARKLSTEQRRALAIARGLTVKRSVVLFDSFFDGADGQYTDQQYINSVLQHFDTATCVIFSSDPRLAGSHTVVLDGGVTVFEGDAEGAREQVNNLYWLSRQVKE